MGNNRVLFVPQGSRDGGLNSRECSVLSVSNPSVGFETTCMPIPGNPKFTARSRGPNQEVVALS